MAEWLVNLIAAAILGAVCTAICATACALFEIKDALTRIADALEGEGE